MSSMTRDATLSGPSGPGSISGREPDRSPSLFAGSEEQARALLEALPTAVYTTDAAGRLSFYNEAAATLWGYRPQIGTAEFCGAWKLYWPDGTPLPHEESPMAVALREMRPIRGVEAVAERPDGTRVPFLPFPTPLFDPSGRLRGAVNMLIDLGLQRQAHETSERLAAIVASSDDAILAKDLDGVITSWNEGARRLYGYTAAEAVGRSVLMLMPEDRRDEEPAILERIRRGERVDHYETVRRRKDGEIIDISLTVSPIKDLNGRIVGASKIARDITERKRAEERMALLLREMDHRVKNLFALASSLVTLSARTARTPEELAESVRSRLGALARAHTLTLSGMQGQSADQRTTLHALIATVLSPHDGDDRAAGGGRVAVTGADIDITGSSIAGFALLLHECATNAAKYGALSTAEGRIDIVCAEDDERFVLTWSEHGGPPIEGPAEEEGFGSLLARLTVKGQFGGEIVRDWRPEGLVIRLSVLKDRVAK